MGLGHRLLGGGRGLVAGLVTGGIWWLVETTANRAAGGIVPAGVLQHIAGLDLGLGAAAGLAIGLVAPGASFGAQALALAVWYGFLRVYAPPGFGAETLYLVVAGAGAVLAARVLGADRRGPLALLHVSLLATGTCVAGELYLEHLHTSALRGSRLPLVIAALVVAGVLVDALVGRLVRRRAVRFGAELAVAAAAVLVFGAPLATAPVNDPVVTAVPPPAGTPDVILVSLDTTRADHLSTYGYGRETTPNLTKFAAEALLFTQARSTAGWTLPGHASMHTGLYPSRHGAHLAGGWLAGQSIDGRRNVAFPLAKDKVTLAETLRDRGFQTGGFVANFSYLYRDFGLAQGFQRYDDAPGLLLRVEPHVARAARWFMPGFCLKPFRTARDINAAALDWLDGQPKGRPAFLFVNYMEAHQPWLAEPPFDRWARGLPNADRLASKNLYTHEVKDFSAEEVEFINASYDGQLAQMDAALAELLDALRARGRYENALVIVTADHGDLLGEHGQVGHMGRMLYEPLLHVPMVVKFPETDHPHGTRIETPVQLVDIVPTVVAETGAQLPAGVQGDDLRHVTRPSLAEEDINPFLVAEYGQTYDRAVRVLFDGNWKLITTSRGDRMLFDLAQDPQEKTDLASREPDRVETLARRLEARMGTIVATSDHTQQVN